MSYSINPIATINQTDGTELMKCLYASYTEETIQLLMSLPEFLTLANLHENVLVVLTSPQLGLLPFICTPLPESLTSTDTATEQHMRLDFQILEKKEPIQRRRDLKVKTDIDVEVRLLNPQKGHCIGKIEDLSASGLLFATETALSIGQEFSFLFEEIEQPIQLTARILNQYENGRKNRFGCELQYLSETEIEILRQYVFRMEALQRKKLLQEEDY